MSHCGASPDFDFLFGGVGGVGHSLIYSRLFAVSCIVESA